MCQFFFSFFPSLSYCMVQIQWIFECAAILGSCYTLRITYIMNNNNNIQVLGTGNKYRVLRRKALIQWWWRVWVIFFSYFFLPSFARMTWEYEGSIEIIMVIYIMHLYIFARETLMKNQCRNSLRRPNSPPSSHTTEFNLNFFFH